MNDKTDVLGERFGGRLADLDAAIKAGDEAGFFAIVRGLAAEEERGLIQEVGRLTDEMHAALERFQTDSRMLDLAENEVPNARIRLEHVLKMTDEAAHQTMDLVEQACPPAERAGAAAEQLATLWREQAGDAEMSPAFNDAMNGFLASARTDAEHVRRNLGEVLLTQGYQDLTGQIIRSVITLIDEIEEVLAGLASLSGKREERPASNAPEVHNNAGYGPQVPALKENRNNAVSGQDDVDSLLSGMGL